MTTEEKAQAYDEALERASHIKDNNTVATPQEVAEHIFPELRESEDERIRKEIIEVLSFVPSSMWEQAKTNYKRCISYLEKQKEQKSLNISAASEWLRNHVCHYMNSEYNEFHKCVEYDGSIDKERLINDFEEAMQKEQKPVDFPTTDEEVNEFLETHPKVEVPEKYKTPDFVFKKQEYESHPIISKDTTSVKPAEWSEEDERILKGIIGKIDHDQTYGVSKAEMLSFLKSLRPVSKESLQPHWKPSEEQMDALKELIDDAHRDGWVTPGAAELYAQLKKLM